MSSKQYLDKNWEFTQIGGGEGTKDGEWLKCSKAVTSVHVELLKLGKIPDPFVGLNEHDVQCTSRHFSWGGFDETQRLTSTCVEYMQGSEKPIGTLGPRSMSQLRRSSRTSMPISSWKVWILMPPLSLYVTKLSPIFILLNLCPMILSERQEDRRVSPVVPPPPLHQLEVTWFH